MLKAAVSTSNTANADAKPDVSGLATARRTIESLQAAIASAKDVQELDLLSIKLKIAFMQESAAQERELFASRKASNADEHELGQPSTSNSKGLATLPDHFNIFKNYDFDATENKFTLQRDLTWLDQAMRIHYGKSPELNSHGPRQLVILLGPQNSMSIADFVSQGATWSQTMELLTTLHAKEGRQELAFKKWIELEFFPGLETVEQYIKRYLSITKENFTVENFNFITSPFLGTHFAGSMPSSVKKALDGIIQMDKQSKLAQAEHSMTATTEHEQEEKTHLDTTTTSASASTTSAEDTSSVDPLQLARMRITLRPITLGAYFGFLRSLATSPEYGSFHRPAKEIRFVPYKDLEYYKLPGSIASAATSRSTPSRDTDKSDKSKCSQDPCRHSCTYHHSNGHTTAECTASKAKSHKDHAGKKKSATIGQEERVPTPAGAARPPVPSSASAGGHARPPTPRPADRSVSPSSNRSSPRGVPRVDYSNNGAGKHGTKKLALLQSYDPSSLELDLSDDEEFGYSSDEDATRSFVAMLHVTDTDDMDEVRSSPALQTSPSEDEDDFEMPALVDLDSNDEALLLSDQ
jgi:hypothetical protein